MRRIYQDPWESYRLRQRQKLDTHKCSLWIVLKPPSWKAALPCLEKRSDSPVRYRQVTAQCHALEFNANNLALYGSWRGFTRLT
ncbi:hypothetical protein PM082_008757 [Marasmius tenuissimus]|nr:hypothetical protein PM082_008757 [Marasmius tenuissimus]